MGISRPDKGRPRIGTGLPQIWHDERRAIFSCDECGTERRYGHGKPENLTALLLCGSSCQGEKYQRIVRTILLPKSKLRQHIQHHNGTLRNYDCEEGAVEVISCMPITDDRLTHTHHTFKYLEG